METLMAEITADLDDCRPSTGRRVIGEGEERILVTGTTGTLGTQILAKLVEEPTVVQVYAMNRGRDPEKLRDEQAKALRRQGLSESIADSPKIVFIQGDTSIERMGLEDAVRREILESLTCIVHNGQYSLGAETCFHELTGIGFSMGRKL